MQDVHADYLHKLPSGTSGSETLCRHIGVPLLAQKAPSLYNFHDRVAKQGRRSLCAAENRSPATCKDRGGMPTLVAAIMDMNPGKTVFCYT